MSTMYRLTGRGTRWTKAKWQKFADHNGFTLERGKKGSDNLVLSTEGGYVHLYASPPSPVKGEVHYNDFERFGGNDPQPVLDALDECGQPCLSEHDEGYFQ